MPRVATVQNGYCLLNRSVENALDETLHRLNVSLLAYSPLSFGLLTGKYDDTGLTGPGTRRRGPDDQIRIEPQAALGPPGGPGGGRATAPWRVSMA